MKNPEQLFVYDNSFYGYLSVIHKVFEDNSVVADIRNSSYLQRGLFTEVSHVVTSTVKAKRVWYAIQKKNYHAAKTIYFAFLSESHGMEFLLYKYIKQLFSKSNIPETYISSDELLKIEHMAGLVGREKRRLESSIELKPMFADLSMAYIEAGFNVLPLLSKHYRSVHRNHPWLIVDKKRKYGIYSDGQELEIVSIGNIKSIIAQKRLLQKDNQLSTVEGLSHHNPTNDIGLFNKAVTAA